MSTVLLLVLAVVLLVAAFVLVMAESAINRTSIVRVEALREQHPKKVDRLVGLLNKPQQVLNPLRLVIVLIRLAEATVVTILAFEWFNMWGWIVGLLALNLVVVFVVAETAPRTLGIIHADRAAVALGGTVSTLVGSPPVSWIARFLVWFTNLIVPGKGLQTGPFATPQEFIALADAAVEDEVLDADERDLIESVLEFGGTIVREVMVPRTDMMTIDTTDTVEQALEAATEAGFSRLPVAGENVDDIVGLVYVKDLIRAELDDRNEEEIVVFLRPSRFVPETKRVADLLREMQSESYHMAVVVDEYGGVAGLVTLEDLIEEIVGEIVDEYDVEEPLVERQRDGTLRVDARILIDELNDIAGLELPEGDYDTVGGLVFDRFGRVPTVGETCECDGYHLRVERIQGRRIQRVRVLAVGGPEDRFRSAPEPEAAAEAS